MNKILSSTEILGSFTQGEGEFEVCATGDASFDESGSRLVVELDGFVRPVDTRTEERHFKSGWLPKPQTVRESVSREEAPALAREIFGRWAGKVRQSVPVPLHNQ